MPQPASNDWTSLISSRQTVCWDDTLADVHELFRHQPNEYAAVLKSGKPVGLCSRGAIGFLMASQFGYSIYSRRPISAHMLGGFLQIEQGTTWEVGLKLALTRPGPSFYHDVILIEQDGRFLGLMSVQSLVMLQSQLLSEQSLALKEHQDQIVQAEQLSALGRMATGIAHDFNNALTTILGYAELMMMKPHCMDNAREGPRYLRTLHTAASDAAQVVSRLRDFYRPLEQNETIECLDLNQLVEEAVLLTQPKWKDQALVHGIGISVERELGEIPEVRVNGAEVRDMLTNLMFNAIDAMPYGGVITLRTTTDGPDVVLQVSDTGLGMSEDVRRKCLEPFFTTKGARGTGLGLAMVYGTVKRHEGSLHIESQPGKGSSFIVRLPAFKGERQSRRIPKPHMTSAPLRILLIDDDQGVLDVISAYLELDSNSVETALDGRKGLEKFSSDKFDLVITDRSMPEMSGDELARTVKHIAPDMSIIMLTGFGEFMNARSERPFGVDLVLSKPIQYDELRAAVQRIATTSESTVRVIFAGPSAKKATST
jgi:signal transduction histidine kinase/CheY-like chemotaxis protein